MTPAARIQAAIDVLDAVLAGEAAERALTNWARASRFAGSGDRAGLRDLVFDALRCLRSYAALGGARTGRGLMLGALRAAGEDPAASFGAGPYAPAALLPDEASHQPAPLTRAERLDLPDWLLDRFDLSLGPDAEAAALALRSRAPVFVRVNQSKASVTGTMARLAQDQIAARRHGDIDCALEITENARKLQNSGAFADGWIELQDASSQAAVRRVPLAAGQSVLDFCAGGGGKALAFADRGALVTAHDISPERMGDIPRRAARAGQQIRVEPDAAALGRFDVVFCDAPCSGSGTWRRAPEAKWRLTPERLQALRAMQAEVLRAAATHVRPGGLLAYATCSVLTEENAAQVAAFRAERPQFDLLDDMKTLPGPAGDGFYLAVMKDAG